MIVRQWPKEGRGRISLLLNERQYYSVVGLRTAPDGSLYVSEIDLTSS
jgi:hypothetical protein